MINRLHKRYGIYQKISQQIPEPEAIELFNSFINLSKKIELTKGRRIMNFDKVIKGWDGDDFVKDLITYVVVCNIYKIPRFLKRVLC